MLDCDDYEVHTVDPLIEEYARTGEAKFEFRNYSLGQAETTKAAYAATAAGQQDREWQFVETFFRNQDAAPAGNVSEEFLNDIVNSITDLDLATWQQDMASPEVKARVDADAQLAADYGLRVNGPSIVVEGPGGTKVLQDSPVAGGGPGRGTGGGITPPAAPFRHASADILRFGITPPAPPLRSSRRHSHLALRVRCRRVRACYVAAGRSRCVAAPTATSSLAAGDT